MVRRSPTPGYSTGATLAVVFDNFLGLKQRGMLEAAVIEGYVGCKTDHRKWPLSTIQFLFDLCDRDKLRALGHRFRSRNLHSLQGRLSNRAQRGRFAASHGPRH